MRLLVHSCNLLSTVNSAVDDRFELLAKYSDNLGNISGFSINSWTGTLANENLQRLEDTMTIINIPNEQVEESTPQSKITNFAEYLQADIDRLSEETKDMTPEEQIAHLNAIQERFTFEIWVVKNKSLAAEILKSEIKKNVEKFKKGIMPEYNPENLSGVSKGKRSKKPITAAGQTTDKAVASMMKLLGISESEALATIEKMKVDTYKMADKLSIQASSSPLPKKCVGCGGYLIGDSLTCLICKVTSLQCETCDRLEKSLTEVKTRNGVMKVCSVCASKPDLT